LHVDLWWRGENIAHDPGSYLYRSQLRWDGALAGASVHNTVLVDGEDPMTRAGPFLWVDWAQAEVLGSWESSGGTIQATAAQHDGYRGICHRRTVVRAGERVWLVVDDVLGAGNHRVTLGWNLPDSRAKLKGRTLRFQTRPGAVELAVDAGELSLYRAGGLVDGAGAEDASAAWGWFAPRYGRKEPSLRLVSEARGMLPIRIVSTWQLGPRRGAPEVEWSPPGEGMAAVRRVAVGSSWLKISEGQR
jgi:hypothetical protein